MTKNDAKKPDETDEQRRHRLIKAVDLICDDRDPLSRDGLRSFEVMKDLAVVVGVIIARVSNGDRQKAQSVFGLTLKELFELNLQSIVNIWPGRRTH